MSLSEITNVEGINFNQERKTPNVKLFERITIFLNLAMKKELMKSFNIEGNTSDKNTIYGAYVCIVFADFNRLSSGLIKYVHTTFSRPYLKKRMLNLNLPKGVEEYKPPVSESLENSMAKMVSLKPNIPYTPAAVFAFGRDRHTRKEVVTLFMVNDQSSPKDVLRNMQFILANNKPLSAEAASRQ